ncbi:Pentapeptide repeat-containing protein [Micromonospora cremea]|uniref:Pentapeptide repeat-containing protein n=2 Tax=Micromonospora cremea TaxID=709881 RepID=A0A1N5WBB3_9ACTN|nr:Pentapeptide repeat-containing protein [Micromonospora cremea]
MGGALWYAGFPAISRDGTVTARTLFDLLKLVFAVVAGTGGVAALLVAYRRQRVAEHTNKLAEFAHELAHSADVRAELTKALAQAADERAQVDSDRNGVRLLNERFANASEQLGSDKAAIRLAGVYAMAGLADDWQEGRQICIDVLCAYLRMPYTPPEFEGWKPNTGLDPHNFVSSEDFKRDVLASRQEREVRHTVVRLIGAHLRLPDEFSTSWRGHDFDFTGAVFDGGDLSMSTFAGGRASFTRARFAGGEVSFDRASFAGGEVSFEVAEFIAGSVSFTSAKFEDGRVIFDGAIFDRRAEVSLNEGEFAGGVVSLRWPMVEEGARFNLAWLSRMPGVLIESVERQPVAER